MDKLRETLTDAGALDTETPKPAAPLGGDLVALLSWQSQPTPDPRKAAAWNFETDEGWLVTPEECAILAQSQIEDYYGWSKSFQQYCARCIKKGGFRSGGEPQQERTAVRRGSRFAGAGRSVAPLARLPDASPSRDVPAGRTHQHPSALPALPRVAQAGAPPVIRVRKLLLAFPVFRRLRLS
jgi:hypothetical protein